MKKLLLMAAIMMTAGIAQADEPAIVNEPGQASENFKQTLSTLEPSADVLFNAADNDFSAGSSVRLVTLEKVKYLSWLDGRAGWAETKIAYGTLSLALDRVTGQEILKHAHLGVWGGRDFDDHEFGYGVIAGAKATF